jgi:hypothetical protein
MPSAPCSRRQFAGVFGAAAAAMMQSRERKPNAAHMPERVRELNALIEGFVRDTHAVLPKPNPGYKSDAN